MIGNDIVDLRLSRKESNWKRKGWIEKIFTTIEQHYIFEADRPEIQIWKFWSMKEAAYKAHQRRFEHPPKYNPIDFNCILGGKVAIDQYIYKVFTKIADNYIYSIAKESTTNYTSQIFNDIPKIQPFLLQKIAEKYDIDSSVLTIKKNDNQIPIVYINQRPSNILLSITHHGQYSAFVVSN